ncbi:LysR family transcriptional regulator [Nocardia fluminea]|uniref:LysR family transcriptional regulator n=1 Tax=Nocardia fluminea TaxID=134984 RepID=UPI0033ECF17D
MWCKSQLGPRIRQSNVGDEVHSPRLSTAAISPRDPAVEAGRARNVSDAELAKIDLNLLVPLQALLAERSVSRAAELVGVTQPAMSNTLKRLRRVLRDELLIRRRGEYTLTPRAIALLDPLDRALALLNKEVVWPEPFDPSTAEREFTVVATNAAAAVVLPPLIAKLAVTSPGVRIRNIGLDSSVDDTLRDSEVDVALVPDGVLTSHPRERLFEEQWTLIVARDHPATRGGVSLTDLGSGAFAVFDALGQRAPGELALSAVTGGHRIAVRTDDFLLLPLLVAESQLMAVIQEPIARRFEALGMIRIVDSPVPLPTLRIDLVWPSGSHSDQGRVWLRRQFINVADQLLRIVP